LQSPNFISIMTSDMCDEMNETYTDVLMIEWVVGM